MKYPASKSAHGAHPRRRGLSRGCLIAVVAVGLIALMTVGTVVGKYNTIVSDEEHVEAKWSNVLNNYKRRNDLVPNLIETVKGSADFERGVLTDVTEARARVSQVQLPSELPTDPAVLQSYIKAQQGLGGALGRLFAVSENYPQLRTTQGFLSLQDQLEGTENRITVARKDYIEAVRTYNTDLRRFPGNMVAGAFGFEKAAQFTVAEEETAVPKVDFGNE